jgi:hypothetical protein
MKYLIAEQIKKRKPLKFPLQSNNISGSGVKKDNPDRYLFNNENNNDMEGSGKVNKVMYDPRVGPKPKPLKPLKFKI